MAKEITISIWTEMKKSKDGKKTYATYNTKMNIPYINKDGVNEGVKTRRVDLKFKSEFAPKNNAKMFGTLTLMSNCIDAPSVWKVKTTDDGELKFPVVWIKGDWKYTEVEREATQDMFSVGKKTEAPVETPVEEPKSTEPVEVEDKSDLPF